MNYFFIHVPKTSGTTFVDVLQKDPSNNIGYFYPLREKMHKFEERTKDGPVHHYKENPDWRKFNFVVGHFTFDIHEVFEAKDDFRYIGVTRNPVDHYVSTYKALLRMPPEFQEMIFPGVHSFEEYLELDYTHNMQTFYYSGLTLQEIREDKERALQVSIENVEKYFDGVYLTERFDEGLFYFKHKIGIKPIDIPKINVASNKMDQELTPELIEKIRAINDVDLKLYDYFAKRFDQEYNAISGIKWEVKMYRLKNKLKGLVGSK